MYLTIHKPSNPRSQPGSYRPVSLTSHMVKTFERVLKKSLKNFLEVTLALNDGQHAFRARRRCLSQLLRLYNTIMSGMEDGNNVDTAYMDYAKAFDKVDKEILAHEMKRMGVCGNLAIWLFNFLSSRTQIVLAHGTVFGPILFLILTSVKTSLKASSVCLQMTQEAQKLSKTKKTSGRCKMTWTKYTNGTSTTTGFSTQTSLSY